MTSAPGPPDPPQLTAAVRTLLRGDRWVQATFLCSGLLAALYLLPWLAPAQKARLGQLSLLLFVGLVLAALLRRRAEITGARERRFWSDLLAGFAWLAGVDLLYQLPTAGDERLLVLVTIVGNFALAAFYFNLVLATEREPHLEDQRAPASFEGLLAWPGVAVFVFGLLAYFTLVPPFGPQETRAVTPLQTVHLFLALDLYLGLRFLFLYREAGSPRWRTIYGLLGLVVAGYLVDDLLRLGMGPFEPGAPGWPTLRQVFWLLPHAFLVVAIRARHLHLAGPRQGEGGPYEHAGLPAPSGRTLVSALTFPTCHLLFHELGLLDPASKGVRGIVAFVWMLLLGAIALAQMRLLDRRAAEIWEERQRFETQLRTSEDDLRLILERRHKETSLRSSEEKLAKGLALTSEAWPPLLAAARDGLFSIDAVGHIDLWSRGAERLYGWRAEEAQGRIAAELLGGPTPASLTAGPRRLELRQRHREGREVVVECRWAAIGDGGRAAGYLLLARELRKPRPGPPRR